ncbi:MAG: 3-oxoacyl-[acyl-carrier-protein] synthase III C-terminal domain-containing protein [Methanomicrobiales archaeon]
MGPPESHTSVGITSIGYYIPKQVITSAEIAEISGIPLTILTEKFGIEQKHIAGPDEHPVLMAEKAALSAIEKGRINPADINIIAYCGAGCYDYQFWSPSSRLQHILRAPNAFTIDIKGACNGGILAINICNNLLKSDSAKKSALIVCSDKLSPVMNYGNTDTLPFFAIGDGAAAAVLTRDEPSNELLTYEGITDGTCGDYVKIPCVGTRVAELCSNQKHASRISVDPAKALADISPDVFLGNFISVIRKAVLKSGYQTPEISWLLTNQIKKTRVMDILAELGLDATKTRSTMKDFGSIGPGDTIFALGLQRDDALIKPGDLVVLASSGIGFTWGAQVVRYR